MRVSASSAEQEHSQSWLPALALVSSYSGVFPVIFASQTAVVSSESQVPVSVQISPPVVSEEQIQFS